MRVLLDTNRASLGVARQPEASRAGRAAIEGADEVYVSAASMWEAGHQGRPRQAAGRCERAGCDSRRERLSRAVRHRGARGVRGEAPASSRRSVRPSAGGAGYDRTACPPHRGRLTGPVHGSRTGGVGIYGTTGRAREAHHRRHRPTQARPGAGLARRARPLPGRRVGHHARRTDDRCGQGAGGQLPDGAVLPVGHGGAHAAHRGDAGPRRLPAPQMGRAWVAGGLGLAVRGRRGDEARGVRRAHLRPVGLHRAQVLASGLQPAGGVGGADAAARGPGLLRRTLRVRRLRYAGGHRSAWTRCGRPAPPASRR